MVSRLAQHLATDKGGLDAAMADELGGQAAQHGLALISRAVELLELVAFQENVDRDVAVVLSHLGLEE